jgi:hypothetical protein
MVVLDISDLNSVRYGIIGFEIDYMAEVGVNMTGNGDRAAGNPPKEKPVPELEEHHHRSPVSAAKFRPGR